MSRLGVCFTDRPRWTGSVDVLSFLAELLQICSSSYSERSLSGTAANCNQFQIVDSFLQTSKTSYRSWHTSRQKIWDKGLWICAFGKKILAMRDWKFFQQVLRFSGLLCRTAVTPNHPLPPPLHARKNKARPEMKAKLWSVSVGCLPMTVKRHDTAVQQ